MMSVPRDSVKCVHRWIREVATRMRGITFPIHLTIVSITVLSNLQCFCEALPLLIEKGVVVGFQQFSWARLLGPDPIFSLGKCFTPDQFLHPNFSATFSYIFLVAGYEFWMSSASLISRCAMPMGSKLSCISRKYRFKQVAVSQPTVFGDIFQSELIEVQGRFYNCKAYIRI